MALPAQSELPDAWHQISIALRHVVGESAYQIWLESLEAVELKGDVLTVKAPADKRNWISDRFGRTIEACTATVLERKVRVELSADSVQARAVGGRAGDAGRLDDIEPSAAFNPRHSFDQFIIGDGNRLAHAASLAAAELPGQAYNPLFLHAPPGLGKTHLLHAIGNYVLAFGGGATVRYTTVESFTNHFITSLGSRSVGRFKSTYRNADVLLIDDVQFLASKAKTEEELFHTFNALYETGRQLVVTCDRLPRELVALQERLRERFESGLVADIKPPDFATRLAILRKRASLDHIALADASVLEQIAERVTSNIRTLEGALIRVVAYGSLTRRPIDAELTTTVLDTMYPLRGRTSLTVDHVQRTVAEHFEISVSELVSTSRAARFAWPRQLAIHLARELTHSSLGSIGAAFGGRNHGTIHYACARVSERLVADPDVAAIIAELTASIQADQADRGS